MRALGALAVVLIVVLSGCSGKRNSGDAAEPTASERTSRLPSEGPREIKEKPWTEDNGVRYRTYSATGHVTAHLAYIGTTSQIESSAPHLRFNVTDNVTAIIAELRWTGDISDFDLMVTTPKWCPDANIIGPCYTNYWSTGEGPGTIRVERPNDDLGPWSLRLELDRARIDPEGNGEWGARAWQNMALRSDLELYVTLFAGGQPPADFTAFKT